MTDGASAPKRTSALSGLWPCTRDALSDDAVAVVRAQSSQGDRDGHISPEVLDTLRASGYFGLPVPVELEGRGLGLTESCAVQFRLARADPAATIALNMHVFSLGVMVEHWRQRQDTSWLLLEAIATQHRIVASGFAEPGLAGSMLRSGCTAEAVDAGYVVNGRKSPCSLAARADLVCFQVQEVGGAGDILTCLVPTSAPGIRVESTWDWVGMRASESDTLVFDGCEIPDDLVFNRCQPGLDPDGVFAAGVVWFCLTTAASYLGVIDEALGVAVEQMSRQRIAHLARGRHEVTAYHGPLGAVVAGGLESCAAVLAIAAALDSGRAAADVLPTALAIKHRVAGLVATSLATLTEAVGAGSLRTGAPLERLLRDAQAARFHPPTPIATESILAQWLLDGELRLELSERGVTR